MTAIEMLASTIKYYQIDIDKKPFITIVKKITKASMSYDFIATTISNNSNHSKTQS